MCLKDCERGHWDCAIDTIQRFKGEDLRPVHANQWSPMGNVCLLWLFHGSHTVCIIFPCERLFPADQPTGRGLATPQADSSRGAEHWRPGSTQRPPNNRGSRLDVGLVACQLLAFPWRHMEGQQASRRVKDSYVSQLSVSNVLTKHKHRKTFFSFFNCKKRNFLTVSQCWSSGKNASRYSSLSVINLFMGHQSQGWGSSMMFSNQSQLLFIYISIDCCYDSPDSFHRCSVEFDWCDFKRLKPLAAPVSFTWKKLSF